MFNRIFNALFRRVDINSKIQDQIYDAERNHLDHSMSAEHHAALATMFEARVATLKRRLAGPVTVTAALEPAATDDVTPIRSRAKKAA